MNLAEIVFLILAFVTLLGAVLAVSLRNVFHNALSLILCLAGVAGLFIYLNSEFLAVMEVIIYIGAISIAIIFAIMLSQAMYQKNSLREPRKIIRSFLISAALFAVVVKAIRTTQWPWANTEGDYSIAAIGKILVGEQALPFETVSLVLLIAIIGALVIADSRKGTHL